jgi:predicted outer membrane repeat protein
MNRAERRRLARRGLSSTPLRIAGISALIGAGLTGGYLGHRPGNAYAGTYATAQALRPRSAPVCSTGAVQVSTNAQLQAAVYNSTDDSIICITQSIQLSAPLTPATNRSLTLEGRDDSAVTLTAPPSNRHLSLNLLGAEDDTLLVSSLTLTGGRSSGAGGSISVAATTGDRILLIDDTFTDDTAAAGGGAIHIWMGGADNDDTRIVFDNTHWINNSTPAAGGAAYINFDDTLGSAVQITGGSFVGNRSGDKGGALYIERGWPGTRGLSTYGVTFIDDTSGVQGGAIFSRGIVASHDDTFIGNRAPSGGAIFGGRTGASGTVTIIDSYFDDNRALSGTGGAVSGAGPVNVASSTFTDSFSQTSGGAVYGSSYVTSSDSTFLRNSGRDHGGAIRGWSVTSEDDSFTRNSARLDGGAIRATDDVNLTRSVFQDDTALGSGGAVASDAGDITVNGGAFLDDSASNSGGALWAARDVTVSDVTFEGNTASTGSGGAIIANRTARAYRSTFTDNHAPYFITNQRRYGGAIQAGDALYVKYSSFSRNSAGYGGGAVSADETITISNSTFFDNFAGWFGGAIYAHQTTPAVTLSFVTSIDDSAPQGGATLHTRVDGPIARLRGTVFAPAGGPACWVSAGANPPNFAGNSSSSFVTDSSCGGSSGAATINTTYDDSTALGLASPLTTDDTPGQQVIIPSASSPLLATAAGSLIPGITLDQLLVSRSSSTTAGAVQRGPFTFGTQPQDTTVQPGQTATFSAAANPGVGPLTYQWQTSTDGSTWSNVAGAISTSFSVPNASIAQSGTRVRAVVTDRLGSATSNSATLTVGTPTPTPSGPTAPRDPRATAGRGEATVTWLAPTSAGDYPISTYQVDSDRGASTCLLPVTSGTTLACTLTGLTGGLPYRFRVRALSGAGWGAWSDWSDPVTPEPEPAAMSITIVGSREGRSVSVRGTTTGLVGAQVQAMVRLPGEPAYSRGAQRTVGDDGSFTWQRRSGKKTYVYFQHDGIRSNRVIIPVG